MVQQSPRRLELTVTADQAGGKNRHPAAAGAPPVGDGDPPRQVAGRRHPAGRDAGHHRLPPGGGAGALRPGSRSRRPGGHGAHPPRPWISCTRTGICWCSTRPPGVLIHPGPGHYSDTLCNYIAWYYKKAGIAADVHPVQRLDKGHLRPAGGGQAPPTPRSSSRASSTPPPSGGSTWRCARESPGRRRGASTPPSAASPAPSWPARWTLRASPPPPATGCSAPGRAAPWWSWSWTPAAPTRSGYTWPTSATPSPATSSTARRITASSPAPPLHSARLSLRHPVTGEPMAWEQPLPEDMARLV